MLADGAGCSLGSFLRTPILARSSHGETVSYAVSCFEKPQKPHPVRPPQTEISPFLVLMPLANHNSAITFCLAASGIQMCTAPEEFSLLAGHRRTATFQHFSSDSIGQLSTTSAHPSPIAHLRLSLSYRAQGVPIIPRHAMPPLPVVESSSTLFTLSAP